MYSDPSDGHLIARGSDAHQFALVRTLCPPTANNLLPLSYIVLQRYAQVGEGGTYHGDKLLQTLDATNIFVGFVHNEAVSVHLLEGLFEGIQARLGHDLPGPASEGLILLRHTLSPPSPRFFLRWVSIWRTNMLASKEPRNMIYMHYFSQIFNRLVGGLPLFTELSRRVLLGNSQDHEGIERAGAVLQAPAPE